MAGMLTTAALGLWLADPRPRWAFVAAAGALVTTVAAARTARFGPTLAALVAVAAGIAALDTSGRVRAIERWWPETREFMVAQASARLNTTLGAAVDAARDLAVRAAALEGYSPLEEAAILADAMGRGGPEAGVVIFDSDGRPQSWAGRHRVVPEIGVAELSTRISPFYAVLEAHRQAGSRTAVGHVVLAADSAVPDRDQTVAARFTRATGVHLAFFLPGAAPPGGDVFDYCLPDCRGADGVVPDTLFAVQVVPPNQGATKLARLAVGQRWVALGALLFLLVLAVTGGVRGRWIGLVGLAATLVLTPAGQYVGLGSFFSPASYYLEVLGPLSSSAGALFVSGALYLVLQVPLMRRPRWRGATAGLAGALVLIAAPYVVWRLADGITPPVTGVDKRLWISWQLALTTVGASLGMFAAGLMGRWTHHGRFPRWRAPAGVALALGLALLGLLTWRPIADWPAWGLWFWVPAVGLAAWRGPRARRLVAVTVVAGTGAALLTWAAAADGRMLQAERDARRLSGGDPVALGMLDRFAAALVSGPPPLTAGELYVRWQRSPLSADDYPAVLATWAPDGRQLASLVLAELDLGPALFQAMARKAREELTPAWETVGLAPGIHYVGAVPYPDGTVVTVGVAPRSRAIPSVRVARFLRGERRVTPPYEMELAEPVPGVVSDDFTWRRDRRWTVRGARSLDVPGGSRHLHVEIPLPGPGALLVRGALVLILDLALLGLLWLAGEGLAGGLRWPAGARALLNLRSYRTRLAAALAFFFVVPTLGFAAWSIGRLRADADRSRDLLIQQTLSDAEGTARLFSGLHDEVVRDRLEDLAGRLDADLLWYERGVLQAASAPVLGELGLLDAFLDPPVHRMLSAEDEREVNADQIIAGQPTRVGYLEMGASRVSQAVLASPRLVDVRDLREEREDLAFGLILTTLVGLAGAGGLAAAAARTLARPVQSLRHAAETVGRGQRLPPFSVGAPAEFVPVMTAFERMARDVEASQAALEMARRRTAAVLANVATGVVAVDRAMWVTMANVRAAELVGAELPIGTDLRRRGAKGWSDVWGWVAGFMAGGAEVDAREFSIGMQRIRAQVAPLHSDPAGCVIALDDTTESSRATRVLAWGELARQIAHEVKNPLTPIRLGVQHLLRARRDGRVDFDAALDRTSRQILAEIERLDAIARAFSRFGAPPAEAAPLAVADLGSIARDAAELYALAGGTDVRVDVDGPVEALVRRDEVKEVLINLVENARDAQATAVTIQVRAGADARATIRVMDNGRGITKEHLPRIFEPQFSTTTSGTGLGLAICKRLVDSWGGDIGVESEAGVGTTVVILLGKAPSGVV